MVNIRSNYGGGSSGGDPVKWFRGKVTRIEDGIEDALRLAMEDGAEIMRNNIATRGTVNSGKSGRIETGKMIGDVKSRVYPGTDKGNQVGRFGWIDNREDYYGYQEGGFEHVNGGEVEGMYALQDAAELAFREFQRAKDEALRNA